MKNIQYGEIASILVLNGDEGGSVSWEVGENVIMGHGDIGGVIAEIRDTSDEYGTNFVCTDDKGNALLYFTGGSYQLSYNKKEEEK